MATRSELDERFQGDALDPEVWFPYYLPHWSSREQSAATYSIRDGELHLMIPTESLSGAPTSTTSRSGLGSTDGQLRRAGRLDDWPTALRGGAEGGGGATDLLGLHAPFRPRRSRTCAAHDAALDVRLLAAGIEDEPERSGEILRRRGLRRRDRGWISGPLEWGSSSFRDLHLTERLLGAASLRSMCPSATPMRLIWNPSPSTSPSTRLPVRSLDQSPGYPMQLMIGVFDFPARDPSGRWADHVPELVVSSVKGSPLS